MAIGQPTTAPGTAGAAGLTVGTTAISGGTDGGVLFNDGGNLGNTAAGTAGFVLTSNGAGGDPTFQVIPGLWTYVNLTADRVNATTSYADITDHSFAMLANTNYEIEAVYLYDANATTTGMNISWTGPAAPTITYGMTSLASGVANRSSVNSVTGNDSGTANDGSMGATGGATNCVVTFKGIWKNGANAGTLQMRFISEVAVALAITLKAGSILKYRTF
jgi:hypothetical protein